MAKIPYRRRVVKKAKVSAPMKKAISRIVNSNLGPEKKYHSTVLLQSTAAIISNSTGWLFYDTCATVQDKTDSTRIGDNIKIDQLSVKIQLSANTTFVKGTFRIFMFQWHADNTASTPVNTDLFQTSISGATDAMSHPNEDLKKGHKVTMLYDKTYDMVNVTADSAIKHMTFNCPLRYAKKKLQYVSGQIFGFDHIYLGFIADKAYTGTVSVTPAFTSRLYFHDC